MTRLAVTGWVLLAVVSMAVAVEVAAYLALSAWEEDLDVLWML